MSQNHEMLSGTNIPADPRKRTRNHARMSLTLWFDVPDSVIERLECSTAVDALRKFHAQNVSADDINSLRENMNTMMGYSKDDEHPGIAAIVIEVAP